MTLTTVALVHAHALFREGLRRAMARHKQFRVVGEAENGQQALQLVDQVEPDLVIMDTDLPGINGVEVARAMKRTHPHVRLVLLGNALESQSVLKAIRAGVAAFVPSNSSWEALQDALVDVCNGGYPINDMVLTLPDVASEVLAAFRQMVVDESVQNVYSPLSSRELEVLELIAAGRTNKEIAADLVISNQTVKNHVSSILRKLAVNDRTQAVVYAMRRGWIALSPSGE